MNDPKIFCALDTSDLKHACSLAEQIGPVTGGLKLGMEFVNSFGPQGIDAVLKASPDAALFIDLKFHDIPNTVAKAVKTVSENFHPAYLNVHATGGKEMMQRAKESCADGTKLLAVTILTSLNQENLDEIGYAQASVQERVCALANLAQKSGLDGIVCSSHEIEPVRATCGDDFVLMVPGIRPAGTDSNDQKRIMMPTEALSKGATHLVIGRPITGADDPAKAAQDILDDL